MRFFTFLLLIGLCSCDVYISTSGSSSGCGTQSNPCSSFGAAYAGEYTSFFFFFYLIFIFFFFFVFWGKYIFGPGNFSVDSSYSYSSVSNTFQGSLSSDTIATNIHYSYSGTFADLTSANLTLLNINITYTGGGRITYHHNNNACYITATNCNIIQTGNCLLLEKFIFFFFLLANAAFYYYDGGNGNFESL
jgi:hypothetical protein